MAWYHEHISETSGVCGGYPCIGRSRVSVRLVIEGLQQGATFDDLLRMWPHLRREQVEAAVAYYLNHPTPVDEDMRRHQEAWEQLTSEPVES
jgi:uncharacterized protein (DUF433 family)